MGLSSLRMKRSLTLNLILTLTVSTVASHRIADLRKFKVIGRRNIVIIFIAHFLSITHIACRYPQILLTNQASVE